MSGRPPRPLHVLVVDDEPLVRQRLVRMLESNGYRVTQAENGEAALHALATMAELPSLVVLDWWMPIMTGEAFLQAIQVDPKLSSLPVAILSSDPEAAIRFSRPYVPKPFTTDVLLHVLARMMRKRR